MTVPGALLALALLRGGDPAAAAVLATATASLFNKAPAGLLEPRTTLCRNFNPIQEM